MELPVLNFGKCFLFKRSFPSRCNGVFRFDEVCTQCEYFLECMLLRIAEFGCAGRPRTLLKDTLLTAFLFHKKVPPYLASYLVKDIKPFATQRSSKLMYTVKKQVKSAYSFGLYGDFMRGWLIRVLKEKNQLHFYSRVSVPGMFVDWMTGDQVMRVALAAKAVVSRLIRVPLVVLSYEASGWCIFQLSRVIRLRRVSFGWIPHPSGGPVRRAMKHFIADQPDDMKLPFKGLPYISRKAILCLQIESDADCIKWLRWIEKFRDKVVFAFVAYKRFRQFEISQCVMFPVGFCTFENTHYPFLAMFDVFNVSKLRLLNEAYQG